VWLRVGVVAEPVHLGVRLWRTKKVAQTVEQLKSCSSRWLRAQSPDLSKFAWRRGYGAFSVGPADLGALIEHIDAQEIHHRKQSFQDELRAFLKKYGIGFDERYLWD